MPRRDVFVLAETRAVGRTYGSRDALMLKGAPACVTENMAATCYAYFAVIKLI
jgi:hypothetical protein